MFDKLQWQREYREKNPERDKRYATKYSTTLERRFSNLKASAKRRTLEMRLTFEEYCKFVNNPCFYCQNLLGDTTKATGGGLDRWDNDKGYINDNVVPCCPICNKVRMDNLTPRETMYAVAAILVAKHGNI